MKHRFISFDLDGTLLYDLTTISEENYQALAELDAMGVTLVPTTGRTLYEIPERIRTCPYFKYMITSSGAYTYDLRSGEILSSHLIGTDQLSLMNRIIRDYDNVSMIHYEGDNYVDASQGAEDYERCRLTAGFKRIIGLFGKPVEDYNSFFSSLKGAEMVCVFFSSDKEKEECRARLSEEGFTVVASAKDNIEIISGKADKGLAVIELANSLGIPVEETIGVGDSMNDLAMITSVDIGIAMANGTDELKARADHIACHYKEHIAKYILENFFR